MMQQWVSSSQLKTPAEAGDGIGVRKTFSASMEIPPDGTRTARFRITTGAVDRERDTIDPRGWDVKDFLKSPVIMWAHDYRSPPIGRALSVEADGSGLSAVVEFAPPETYAFADTVYRLVKGGFINATSVGFQPLDWSLNEERRGVDFKRQSLLEVSVCAIPANPEALIEARSAGINIEPLREWAERVLNETADEPGIWIPRKQLVEHVLMKLDGMKTYSMPPSAVTTSNFMAPMHMPLTSGNSLVDAEDIAASKAALAEPERIPYEALAFRDPHADQVLTVTPEQAAADAYFPEHKAVPKDVSTEVVNEGASWAGPTLGDFTDKSWDQITDPEKRKIAGHFAWSRTMPPNNYADLKLPHHRGSDGKVVFRGVAAAMAALFGARGGIAIPEEERRAVYRHLANHYKAYGKQPPEFREYTQEEAKGIGVVDADHIIENLAGAYERIGNYLMRDSQPEPMTLSLEDEVFLELADDDPDRVEWSAADLHQVLSEVIGGAVQEAAARDVGRQVREAMAALTGRVD